MGILEYRPGDLGIRWAIFCFEFMGSFIAIPSEVDFPACPEWHHADLFPIGLSYITHPKVSGEAVKRNTPGIAQAYSPYFGKPGSIDIGIVRRDAVWQWRIFNININP